LRVAEGDDGGVIEVDDDRSMGSAALGVVSGAFVGGRGDGVVRWLTDGGRGDADRVQSAAISVMAIL
jgi:hypothetical protein